MVGQMDVRNDSQITVEQAFASFPGAASVFLASRTGCVGCPLARFCTLEDVARVYELPLQDLLGKLRETHQSSPEENV
jgi:hybrid cluster-associated redox disulfide protein